MRGLEKFLLGIFLPVGVLLLFTAASGVFTNSKTSNNFNSVSAAGCSEVGKTEERSCTTTCDGKTVTGTEVFQCQSNLEFYSDGRCYAPTCTNTSGAKPAGTTTPNSNSSTTSNSTSSGKFFDIFNGIPDLGKLVQNVVQFVLETLGKAIGGEKSTTRIAYLETPKTTAEAYERYGALGAMGLTVQDMYNNPPITTKDYLASLNPIVPIMAQNTPSGSQVLQSSPIVIFWTASRNLAYIFFVLVLVGIGFMLMFRSKIDPRTTVTVTAALPNLVVSLVLITFSLTLAALLIDFGKVLEEVVKAIINGALTGGRALVGGGNPGTQVGLSVGDIWKNFVFDNSNNLSLGDGIGTLVGAFVNLVILVFGFFIGIQVFIMLLLRYISLLVKPIVAPFVFLIGALPGKGHVSGGWFKGYLVDVLTFPLVLIVLNLASAIKFAGALSPQGDPFGLLAPGSNLTSLAALGVLIFATKVPAMLEDAFDSHPSKTVAGAGIQTRDVTKQIPIIKNLL